MYVVLGVPIEDTICTSNVVYDYRLLVVLTRCGVSKAGFFAKPGYVRLGKPGYFRWKIQEAPSGVVTSRVFHKPSR
jgi:hypothetical protein